MVTNHLRPHFRQVALFLVVGLAQLCVDSAMFILLTAVGVPVGLGNVMGRSCGATVGYFLNGRFTFASGGTARLSRSHLRRFVIAWLLLTAVSTALVQLVSSKHSLHAAWLAKPAVEALMASIGFFVWRQWVFR